MEASGITRFKRSAASNTSERLILLIERDKMQREAREEKSEEKGRV